MDQRETRARFNARLKRVHKAMSALADAEASESRLRVILEMHTTIYKLMIDSGFKIKRGNIDEHEQQLADAQDIVSALRRNLEYELGELASSIAMLGALHRVQERN